MEDVVRVKAPWNLRGRGYLILYRFTKDELQKDNFLDCKFKDNFKGGFGAVMIVDYESSDAGPYSELLIIPGKFKYGKQTKNTISRIYVSTQASVINGRENWAIPKHKAEFEFKKHSDGSTSVIVSDNEIEFFKINIKSKFFSFPVNTALLPFPLVQEQDGKAYYTNFKGKGKGKLAFIKNIEVDSNYFPDISLKKPFIAIEVDPFEITFPPADIKPLDLVDGALILNRK